MIRQAILTLVFSVFTLVFYAQDTWSLEECIEYAIEQSLTVEQAEINLENALVNQKEANQSRWPSANISAGFGLNFGRVINPSTNTFETDDSYFNNFGFSTGMPIYAGSRINNTIKQAKVNEQASTEDLKQARVQLAFDVSIAYLNVLFAQENLRNADATLELSQNQLEQIEKLIAAGSRPEAEKYDILAQISLDEQSVVQFDNNITQNLLALKQLMRLEPGYDLQLERPDIQEQILERIDTYTFDEVYQAALQTQPQVRAQELRIESSMLQEKIAKGVLYPTLSLNGSIGTNWTDLDKTPYGEVPMVNMLEGFSVNGIPVDITQEVLVPEGVETTAYGTQLDNNLGYGVGLNLSIPIYNNYSNKAQLDRATLQIKREQNVDEQIKQQLKTEIQNALASARAARESLEASRAALDAAEIAYQNSERRFDLGALNSYDLISAQNRLDSARVNLTISRYDYVFRILVIEYYLGRGLRYE